MRLSPYDNTLRKRIDSESYYIVVPKATIDYLKGKLGPQAVLDGMAITVELSV